jgi:hypothetical protein
VATWEETPGVISYGCVRCGAHGIARIGDGQKLRPRKPKPVKPERDVSETMAYVEKLWSEAEIELPAEAVAYFRFIRRIDLKDGMPPGDLRFLWHCPWQGQLGGVPCLVARYSDAVTSEPRGLWRRPIGFPDKPMSLGPTGGCVIRLWPDDMIDGRLVIAEGVETALAMAMNMKHHGRFLRPVWAMGSANNMRRFPVIDGVEHLIIGADHDKNGVGRQAADECAQRWEVAGRLVEVLMPEKVGTDFNDWIKS